MLNAFIERHIYKTLVDHLAKKEISLLIGPRQSGKTTLLKKLEKELKKRREEVFYYNLDIVYDKEVVKNQTDFVRFLENSRKSKRCFVIIDEVQRIENPGLYLKGVYDLNLPYKLIVSGSSSLEIKAKIVEPLTGRKKVFRLTTLSFPEFVDFKKPALAALKPIKDLYFKEYFALFDEYLKFGGYPKVVLQRSEEEKIEALEEIYSSYLEKDIKGFFKVKNEASFLTLVNLLAGQVGSLVNKDSLASNIGSNRQTVDNFLVYLEKSFVIRILPPLFRNPKKELTKMPKVYFTDLGLRNLVIKNFTQFEERQDKGELFENFILLKLIEREEVAERINFWRTRVGAEVDFVMNRGAKVFPVETKASFLKRPDYSRSFSAFLKAYRPEKGWIFNLSLKKKEKRDSTLVEFLPFFFQLKL